MRTKFKAQKPWRLFCPQLKLWAGLDNQAQIVPCQSPDDARVQVFDERDDQAMKIKFYGIVTGIKWEAQCAA